MLNSQRPDAPLAPESAKRTELETESAEPIQADRPADMESLADAAVDRAVDEEVAEEAALAEEAARVEAAARRLKTTPWPLKILGLLCMAGGIAVTIPMVLLVITLVAYIPTNMLDGVQIGRAHV